MCRAREKNHLEWDSPDSKETTMVCIVLYVDVAFDRNTIVYITTGIRYRAKKWRGTPKEGEK